VAEEDVVVDEEEVWTVEEEVVAVMVVVQWGVVDPQEVETGNVQILIVEIIILLGEMNVIVVKLKNQRVKMMVPHLVMVSEDVVEEDLWVVEDQVEAVVGHQEEVDQVV